MGIVVFWNWPFANVKPCSLGLIAVKHMILADQKDLGTLDIGCLKLAELHSTAVDYSKTGIPVEESQFRKLGKTTSRPDL